MTEYRKIFLKAQSSTFFWRKTFDKSEAEPKILTDNFEEVNKKV